MEDAIVKKKRGRKPKIQQEIVLPQPEPESIQSKRGRKPKYIYNSHDLNPVVAETNNDNSEDENIIVRLNVSNVNQLTDNASNIISDPCAYNCDNYCNISNVHDDIQFDMFNNSNMSSQLSQLPLSQHLYLSQLSSLSPHDNLEDNLPTSKVVNILKDFEEKNKNKEWPSNTSICCYWCCHRFDNAPFGIPVNYQNEHFNVYGCFCSLECASAYNFKANDSADQMWERYNLINMLSRKINFGNLVKPAPDRIALKIFGGYLEIDKFRESFKTNKILNINFPPMSSLTQQIEEINDYELNNDSKYIPIDNDRINKFKEKQLLFKRNKPLINSTNTLESTMNLSIKYN
jgi:hypothetical protein